MAGRRTTSEAPRRLRDTRHHPSPQLRRRISAAIHRQLFPRSVFDGLELYFEPPSMARVRESLQLVKEADPLRWRRLQRYMPLMVEGYGGSGFNRVWGTGSIDVAKWDSWRLAGSIVHELTHAYVFERWKVPYRGEMRQRHEKLCLKEELRLYRRLITAFNCDELEARAWLAGIDRSHKRAVESRWWERSRWYRFVTSWRAFWDREAERELSKRRK